MTNLTQEELKEKLTSLRKEHFDLRMQAGGGKLDKPHKFREVKKTIARILTLQRLFALKKDKG